MRRALVRSLVALLLLALFSVAVVAWIGSERALRPAYHRYGWTLATFSDLHAEPIQFRVDGDIVLQGRFFRGDRRSLVILASGYGDTQDQMLSIADFLHQAGFGVLTYNSRARATSGGKYVTLGALEQGDMISLLSYAAALKDVDPTQIGVLGISMGGATAILAAARDQRIRAVVDDSGFSDAPGVIATSFEHFIHLPAFPFALLSVSIASLRAGIDVSRVRPMDVISEISPRPLLIIHETDDAVVPAENSLRNFGAAREPKELWLPPGSGHGQAHTIAKSEYESRVVRFFKAAIH